VADAVEVVPQVLAEIQGGDGLGLAAAGRLFPAHRGNGSVDPSTVFRWIVKGVKSVSGVPVKLEAVRVGGRWLTSRGAIARFVAATTATTGTNSTATIAHASAATVRKKKSLDQTLSSLKRMGA